jgi:hypothetical protein
MIPLTSIFGVVFGVADPCDVTAAKFFPTLTGPFKFARPVTETPPLTSIKMELF